MSSGPNETKLVQKLQVPIFKSNLASHSNPRLWKQYQSCMAEEALVANTYVSSAFNQGFVRGVILTFKFE
jgi:hypothetical protein